MNLQISQCRYVGAMVPPAGKSSFDETSIVVTDGNGTYLRVDAYVSDSVTGEAMTYDEWQLLVGDGQATQIGFDDVKIQTGTVLWALRWNFEDRDSALDDLRCSGALIAPVNAHAVPESAHSNVLALVIRPVAISLRDKWKERALSNAEQHATLGRWESATAACEQGFALATELDARTLGLLILSYEHQGRLQRAKGYLEVAERSKGTAFREEVQSHCDRWGRMFSPETTTTTRTPGLARSSWKTEHKCHLEDSQRALAA